MEIIFIFLIFFHSVFARILENVTTTSYAAIPQIDGTFRLMNASEVEKTLQSVSLSYRSELDVSFSLFTQRNPKQGQFIPLHDHLTLSRSNFNPSNPTRIIIHGWRNNGNSNVNQLIRDAYLQRGNFNVFVVDWGSVAHSINYISAKGHVENVGQIVAQFIDFLHIYGRMSFKTLYLIGHSLGAHASGFAGKFVTNGKINTIIGLDPASPLFPANSPDKRLDMKDAEYVETIHTNGNELGFLEPIGHSSFYPNWGKKQPGCGEDLSGRCSHSKSYQYFAKSIGFNNPFISIQCGSFDEIKQQTCTRHNTGGVRMGGDPSNYGKANGIYYVSIS